MMTNGWIKFGTNDQLGGWILSGTMLHLYGSVQTAERGYAWAAWEPCGERSVPVTAATGHTRTDLLAYCKRERITLPELPGEWCPEPTEEPAKPYSLADDPRLREVVRTKWGEARWYEGNGNDGMHLAVDRGEGFDLASVYPDGRWIAYSGPTSADEIQRASKATNPATAYDECMAALRDLGSLVDEEPEPDADDWIPWGGGECPVPTVPGLGFWFKYRSGTESALLPSGLATNYSWEHGDEHHHPASNDIVAFRLAYLRNSDAIARLRTLAHDAFDRHCDDIAQALRGIADELDEKNT